MSIFSADISILVSFGEVLHEVPFLLVGFISSCVLNSFLCCDDPFFLSASFLFISHALCTLLLASSNTPSFFASLATSLIFVIISSRSLLSCVILHRVCHIAVVLYMICFLIFRASLSAVASLMPIFVRLVVQVLVKVPVHIRRAPGLVMSFRHSFVP